jgi:hypothetical protein
VDRQSLAAWIELYERAWRTAGTDLLAELFTGDAEYKTSPFAEPVRGLAAIGELWEREREGPDEPFTLAAEILAVEGDLGVARTDVVYGRPAPHSAQRYRNLWLVRLDDEGRCTSFEEWYWAAPAPENEAAQPELP